MLRRSHYWQMFDWYKLPTLRIEKPRFIWDIGDDEVHELRELSERLRETSGEIAVS